MKIALASSSYLSLLAVVSSATSHSAVTGQPQQQQQLRGGKSKGRDASEVFPGRQLSESWTGWHSEEDSPKIDCGNRLVAGFACKGNYCDKRSLFCTDSLSVAGRISIVDSYTYTSAKFSEEEHENDDNRVQCSTGYFMTGMQCYGNYCDSIHITCNKFVITDDAGYVKPLGRGNCRWTEMSEEYRNGDDRGVMKFRNGYYAAGMECHDSYCDDKKLLVCNAGEYVVTGEWKTIHQILNPGEYWITEGIVRGQSETRTEEWGRSVTLTASVGIAVKALTASASLSATMSHTLTEEHSRYWETDQTNTLKEYLSEGLVGKEMWQWAYTIQDPTERETQVYTMNLAYTQYVGQEPKCLSGFIEVNTDAQMCVDDDGYLLKSMIPSKSNSGAFVGVPPIPMFSNSTAVSSQEVATTTAAAFQDRFNRKKTKRSSHKRKKKRHNNIHKRGGKKHGNKKKHHGNSNIKHRRKTGNGNNKKKAH